MNNAKMSKSTFAAPLCVIVIVMHALLRVFYIFILGLHGLGDSECRRLRLSFRYLFCGQLFLSTGVLSGQRLRDVAVPTPWAIEHHRRLLTYHRKCSLTVALSFKQFHLPS